MQYRHLYPMVRILLPFMAGIIVSQAISASVSIPIQIWISLLILTVAAQFIPFKKFRFVKRLLFGILASSFLFVSGYNSVLLHKEILRPDHFSKTQNSGIFIATVDEPLQEKNHSFKTILKVKGLKKGNLIVKAEGLILTYFAKDSILKPPVEGSTITFSGNVQIIAAPQNPGAFDYRKYMSNNNVYHQVYLNNTSWKLLENPKGFNVFRKAHMISQKFISILNENGLKGREFAVASALMLGQKDMLDNETLQAYSGSGVMHVLCVSGLHVGVIYLIINFLLGFIKSKGRILIFKTALIIISIWAYAILTGLSPSVMRAAAMFSFISVGNASKRYVHIINSLAVSAMLLLIIDPLMISNIGFQLSYIAILGIVFINKPIANLWDTKNRIAEYIWGLIAVSIAAQIATAPLALFYFHQFPAYFIPANLVAIPLSFLAIYSGVAVLVISFIPIISNILGLLTNYLLFALNNSVEFIEKLPYSVFHVTSIFTKETILIYMIIISIILFFTLKRKEWLYPILGVALVLSSCFAFTEIMRQRQQKIIFYSTGKQSAMGFINGEQQILLADSVLIKDKIANKFQLAGAQNLYGIKSGKQIAIDTIGWKSGKLGSELKPLKGLYNYLFFHNKRIAFIDRIPEIKGNYSALKVDYLVIRKNPKIKVSELQKLYTTECIIIDGSNSFYKTSKWMDDCKLAGIKAHSIKDSGAYIVDL